MLGRARRTDKVGAERVRSPGEAEGARPGRALLGIGKQEAELAVGGPAGCGSNPKTSPLLMYLTITW